MRSLRAASWAEGATLLILLLVAVPMKRLWGWPEAVSWFGPLHGGAFLLYVSMVMRAKLVHWINLRQTFALVLAALVPFGFLMVNGVFRDVASRRT